MLSTTSTPKSYRTATTVKKKKKSTANMKNVSCVVLGGGHGTRLHPLTTTRSKPAIPFGGRYRLIDVPLSNALNSGCTQIFVITQFLSTSLHHHIHSTYQSHPLKGCSIDILAAEQKPNSHQWFLGTADAVRKNVEYLSETSAEYFLILSGDQLYQMSFEPMLEFALKTEADLVIATLPIDKNNAPRMGILKVDNQSNIVDFVEKPQDPAVLDAFRCPVQLLEDLGHTQTDEPFYLGSMGIYLFKREALFRLLQADAREDFGKHLIPTKVAQKGVVAYLFDGYWEDIGTVESYYNANMALTRPEPFFNCYDEEYPLYTKSHNLPAPKIFDTNLSHSIVCEGAVIEAKEIKNSILGPRTIVKHGTVIRDSYLIGNDHYVASGAPRDEATPLQIGRNCVITNAIIDSDVHLGDNVELVNKQKVKHYDGEKVFIRDGVIIVTRGVHLPDGFVL